MSNRIFSKKFKAKTVKGIKTRANFIPQVFPIKRLQNHIHFRLRNQALNNIYNSVQFLFLVNKLSKYGNTIFLEHSLLNLARIIKFQNRRHLLFLLQRGLWVCRPLLKFDKKRIGRVNTLIASPVNAIQQLKLANKVLVKAILAHKNYCMRLRILRGLIAAVVRMNKYINETRKYELQTILQNRRFFGFRWK